MEQRLKCIVRKERGQVTGHCPAFSLSQMSNDELAQSLPWREKVHENKYITKEDTDLCPSTALLEVYFIK